MTWEEQLEEFGDVHGDACGVMSEDECDCEIMKALKTFIRTQKSQGVQETLEAVRAGLGEPLSKGTDFCTGYNTALEEVRALLLSLTPSKE